jgi:hypothetical protein
VPVTTAARLLTDTFGAVGRLPVKPNSSLCCVYETCFWAAAGAAARPTPHRMSEAVIALFNMPVFLPVDGRDIPP